MGSTNLTIQHWWTVSVTPTAHWWAGTIIHPVMKSTSHTTYQHRLSVTPTNFHRQCKPTHTDSVCYTHRCDKSHHSANHIHQMTQWATRYHCPSRKCTSHTHTHTHTHTDSDGAVQITPTKWHSEQLTSTDIDGQCKLHPLTLTDSESHPSPMDSWTVQVAVNDR